MAKKIYLKVQPKLNADPDNTLNEALDKLSTLKNIERVEGQVGYTGKNKKRNVKLFIPPSFL